MRKRLALAIAAVAAGAVVLFAVPLGIALRKTYRDEDLLRLQRDTVAETRAIDVGSEPGDHVELPRSRDALAVYDRQGRRLAGRGPAAAGLLVRSVLRSGRPAEQTSGNRLVAVVPLLVGERVTGALRAERSTSGADDDTREAWRLLAALAGAIMVIALVAALVLGRRLARPLERLASAAGRLGLGDFSVRAPRTAIPEVDRVAAALDATATRLEELVSRERAFSADASHQLRTPLAALRIELESMQLARGGADVDAAIRQVDRLEETIATLLAVARDTPRLPGDVDLAALVDDVAATWRPRLAADGRPLRVELGPSPLTADASEAVVRQIVEVLVDNAARHGDGAVSLAVRRRDGWLSLDVADEGSGFADDADDAFERRTSRAGHGIGLALARSLAHAEGGRLSIAAPGPRPVMSLALRAIDTGDSR